MELKANYDKFLDLLDNGKLDELRELLKIEREKAILTSKGKETSLLKAVEKYLKQADASRPILKTVQHTKDGKQFILDGFTAVVFKNYTEELESFPQTDEEKSLDFNTFLKCYNGAETELTGNDGVIWENLDKFIKLNATDKKSKLPIYFCGAVYNARLLLKIKDFIKGGFTIIGAADMFYGIMLENKDVKAVILPIRINEDGGEIKIKEQTQEFINKIKEQKQ